MSSIKTEANIMENLDATTVLKGKDSISLYVKNYYEKLYMNEDYEEGYQDWFLQFISK